MTTIWKAQWRPRRKLIVVVVMLSQFRQHRESLPGPRLAFVATPRSESSRGRESGFVIETKY